MFRTDEINKLKKVVIVGLGGIGGVLAPHVARFLASVGYKGPLILADGDSYEKRNEDRMEILNGNSKAPLVKTLLNRDVLIRRTLTVIDCITFITKDDVEALAGEDALIFSCVDNHATRKLLSDYATYCDNCILISGGNDGVTDSTDGTYGNVQVYIREGCRDITAPLTKYHPEIENYTDENPGDKNVVREAGCDEIAESDPQLYFANIAAATAMLMAFTRIFAGEKRPVVMDEICFDIKEGIMTPSYLTTETARILESTAVA